MKSSLDLKTRSVRYADGVRSFDFDRNLGPYPLELREQWAELTRHTTAELVQKIEPISGRVRSKRAEYDAATNPKAAEDCLGSLSTFDDPVFSDASL